MDTVKVATWNLEWAGSRSHAAPTIRRRLQSVDPDVAVLTEACLPFIKDWPHYELAQGGRYPGTPDDAAKVTIVSKNPLNVIDHGSDEELVRRNFLAVDMTTETGRLRVIGVVVRFNQIKEYIDRLPALLARTVVPGSTVLAGDFNLGVPGGDRSRHLLKVLAVSGLKVHTGGTHAALGDERRLVDHIATSDGLKTDLLTVWPRKDPTYKNGTVEVTDHAGASLQVSMPQTASSA